MAEVISGPDIVVFVSLKIGPTGQLDGVDSDAGLQQSQLANHTCHVDMLHLLPARNIRQSILF